MEIVPWILAIVSSLFGLWERWKKMHAEKELAEIKRRAAAPFLNAVRMVVGSVAFTGENNKVADIPSGAEIELHLSNTGRPAKFVTDDWPSRFWYRNGQWRGAL